MSLRKRTLELVKGLPEIEQVSSVASLVNLLKDLYGDSRIDEATLDHELQSLILEVLTAKQPDRDGKSLLEESGKLTEEFKRHIKLDTMYRKRMKILMGRR